MIRVETIKLPHKIYKQAATGVPFTWWSWFLVINDMLPDYGKLKFGRAFIYFQKGYGLVYFDKDKLDKISYSFFKNFNSAVKIDKFLKNYRGRTSNLEKIYLEFNPDRLSDLSLAELLKYYKKVYQASKLFWQTSIFIDSFDPGGDQIEILKIVEKYNFSSKEINILITPPELTFIDNSQLELMHIVDESLRNYKLTLNKKKLWKFIENSPTLEEYRHKFAYSKSDFTYYRPITNNEISAEINLLLKNKNKFVIKYRKLKNYTSFKKNQIEKILKSYNLKTNPLYFFNRLVYWREDRKKYSLIGAVLFNEILRVLSEKIRIDKKYLQYLSPEEFYQVREKGIEENILKQRYNGSILFLKGSKYQTFVGAQARYLKNKLDKKLDRDIKENTFIGQIACPGRVRGFAKIIDTVDEKTNFQAKEILVTSMTRPQFLPIIKKAAGIITNEGGVTCHAAIISRELNKPCIIGTRIATQIIKDGDLIELRADQGKVIILKRNKC